MKEIYEVDKIYNGDGESQYYELEKDGIEDLQDEYKLYLNEFADKIKDRYQTYLEFKHYKIKTDNLKEAIRLSNLDEEDACYDLDLELEEIDKEISFSEIEYILRHIDSDYTEDLFETINEEMPFCINENGKFIDRNYAYSFFKDDIINKLDYEFLTNREKDDFIQIFEEANSKESFIEDAFDNIKLLDNKVKVTELGLTHKDFEKELTSLYERLGKNQEIENLSNFKEELLKEFKNIKNDSEKDTIIINAFAGAGKTTYAIKNKNHPSNNIFKEPEISADKSNELYQKLVLKTDIRKNDLLEMFRNKKIYADEKGNAIFPIKDNDNKIIGAYSLNINNNEKPLLLDGSYTKNNDLEKSENLANKIYENFKQEIVEEIEEMEIE